VTRARDAAPRRDDERQAGGVLLPALLRLADLAGRPLQEAIGRSHGLGLSEWRTLAALHAHPGSAAIEIAQRTGLDKMSVSRALASLEAAGRVARRPDPRDGRRALASLTAAGRRTWRALEAQARTHERALLEGLSATERRQLLALIERLSPDTPSDRD
jgi:DNA-binding MarR family transcriptional regulator